MTSTMRCFQGVAMFLLGILQAPAAVAQSAPESDNFTGTASGFCEPERLVESACAWTGDCHVAGCANKCIVNEDLVTSKHVLVDRGFGYESHQACPLIATVVREWVDASGSGSGHRRLQAQHVPDAGHFATIGSRSAGLLHEGVPPAQHRRMLDVLSAAPVTDNIPTAFNNACPTVDEINFAAVQSQYAVAQWRSVLEAEARGEDIPADLLGVASWVLEWPNRYQFLIKVLADPKGTAEFVKNRCEEEVVQYSERFLFEHYLYYEPPDYEPGPQMLQCVHSMHGFDKLTRDRARVRETCDPPFGERPDCFSATALGILTSTACAESYARMYNVSDVTILVNIANTVEAIQAACTGVATEEECKAARTPAVDAITSYHDAIPVRNAPNESASRGEPPQELAPVPTVCFTAACESAGNSTGDDSGGGGDSSNVAAAAGAAAGAALFGLLIAAFVGYRMKKRKKADKLHASSSGAPVDTEAMQNGSGAPGGTVPTGDSRGASGWAEARGPHLSDTHSADLKPGNAGPSALAAGPQLSGWPAGMPAGVGAEGLLAWAAGRSSAYNANELRITMATTVTAGSDWTDFQRAANVTQSPLDQLEVALEAMCCMAAPFHSRYQVHSAMQRRVGGQGIVQFATIINTEDKVAIKFYMDKGAFQRERDLYRDPALKSMMPATLAVEDNASGEHATPYGYTFPPFVIIECGQSLDEWAEANVHMDFATIYQALSHSVRALAKLHGTGYAHRDIKPGNILRRPKQHDWTLIDFGCAAQTGTTAGLAFSLKYAPPEVIQALERGDRTILVDAAVDIWAIGVIAFELLTGERAFPLEGLAAAEAEAAARDAIMGRTPLPWEEASEAGRDRLGKMRVLKRTVMQCLKRDPSMRPGAQELLKSWDRMFDELQGTSTQNGGGVPVRTLAPS